MKNWNHLAPNVNPIWWVYQCYLLTDNNLNVIQNFSAWTSFQNEGNTSRISFIWQLETMYKWSGFLTVRIINCNCTSFTQQMVKEQPYVWKDFNLSFVQCSFCPFYYYYYLRNIQCSSSIFDDCVSFLAWVFWCIIFHDIECRQFKPRPRLWLHHLQQ